MPRSLRLGNSSEADLSSLGRRGMSVDNIMVRREEGGLGVKPGEREQRVVQWGTTIDIKGKDTPVDYGTSCVRYIARDYIPLGKGGSEECLIYVDQRARLEESRDLLCFGLGGCVCGRGKDGSSIWWRH